MKSIVAVFAFFIFSSVAFSLTGSETIMKTCKDYFPTTLLQECKTITEGKSFEPQAVKVCGAAFSTHIPQHLMTCWRTIAGRNYLPGIVEECHSLSASSSYLYWCLGSKSQPHRNLR